MEKEFWQERWERREIGFHRSDIHWALEHHWADISPDPADRVLVPLCGKSLDMRWLGERGHEVVGVELSERAIREFYKEWGAKPARTRRDLLTRWQAGNIAIVEGDFFDFRADPAFDRFYDRAALVALPRVRRGAYLAHLRDLLNKDATGLLATFEYDQQQMDGPPFSVPEKELRGQDGLRFELLERRDTLDEHQAFAERGLTALHECAWLVRLDAASGTHG